MTFEPSPKSDEIEEAITKVMGKDRIATIKSFGCMTCDVGLVCTYCRKTYAQHKDEKHDYAAFRTALDVREYEISGMCQACQDKVFGTEDN